jgi:hypothetical protein
MTRLSIPASSAPWRRDTFGFASAPGRERPGRAAMEAEPGVSRVVLLAPGTLHPELLHLRLAGTASKVALAKEVVNDRNTTRFRGYEPPQG